MAKNDTEVIEQTLRELISKAVKKEIKSIDPESTFKDLGVDSLEVVHILVALEDRLGIDIKDQDLTQISNMGAFIDYLSQKYTRH